MDEKEALILGAMLGDGTANRYGNQSRIAITGHSIDDKEFLLLKIKPLLEEVFKTNVHINNRKIEFVTDLIIYSKSILNLINGEWGYPLGKKFNIEIPKKFVDNEAIMNNIIKGFFATDGSLVLTNNNGTIYPRVEFSNISLTILGQIKDFLLRFGIKGGLYISHKLNPTHPRNVYRLQFNGRENLFKFQQSIGFFNPKHNKKFENYLKIRPR